MKIKKLALPFLIALFTACGNPDYDQGKSDWIDTLDEIPEDDLQKAPSDAPYGFETGVIEYESTTMGMKQQVITMFCDYGKIMRTEIISKMLGQSIKQLTLVNDTAIFNLNLIDSMGTYSLVDSSERDLNFRALTDDDMRKHEIQKTGSDEVLDKNCTIYEMRMEDQNADIKNWIWEGITLKSVTTMGGIKVTMIAKKLRVNVDIPKEKFEVPEGFSIRKTEADSMFVQ